MKTGRNEFKGEMMFISQKIVPPSQRISREIMVDNNGDTKLLSWRVRTRHISRFYLISRMLTFSRSTRACVYIPVSKLSSLSKRTDSSFTFLITINFLILHNCKTLEFWIGKWFWFKMKLFSFKILISYTRWLNNRK